MIAILLLCVALAQDVPDTDLGDGSAEVPEQTAEELVEAVEELADDGPSDNTTQIIVAILGMVGTVVAGLFGYRRYRPTSVNAAEVVEEDEPTRIGPSPLAIEAHEDERLSELERLLEEANTRSIRNAADVAALRQILKDQAHAADMQRMQDQIDALKAKNEQVQLDTIEHLLRQVVPGGSRDP